MNNGGQYLILDGTVQQHSMVHSHLNSLTFHYGIGLFETMLVYKGSINLWDYHFRRMEQGAEILGIKKPESMNSENLRQLLVELAAMNGNASCSRIRMQLFLDGGLPFDYKSCETHILAESWPHEQRLLKFQETGLTLGVFRAMPKVFSRYSHLKTTNALPYLLAGQYANNMGWNDALLVNSDEKLVESSISNLFIVLDGKVITPPIVDGCVDGVMRRYIMEKIGKVEQQSITVSDLKRASGAFLTNALRPVRWVAEFEGMKYLRQEVAGLYDLCFRDNFYED